MTATPAQTEVMPPSTEECSTNFYWTVGQNEIFNLQTTLRGQVDPAAVKMHITGVLESLKDVIKLGGHAKAVGRAPEPQAATTTAPSGGSVTTSVVATAAPTPTAPGALVVRAAKLEVTPRADGKVDAKFYEAGHNYPDLYATKSAGELAAMLTPAPVGGPWTPDKFTVANTFTVSMAIEYALSDRLNKNGKPYKNIVAVRPA